MRNFVFPLGLECQWQPPGQLSMDDPCLKNWLLDTGSLTERLQANCQHFHLQLLGQASIAPHDEEIKRLACQSQQDAQVREVLLYGDDQPWVFARSVIPQALCQSELHNLGNKPLGQIIFNDNRFTRAPFELAKLAPDHPLLSKLAVRSEQSLWARRSCFSYQHWQMLVAEVFLPASPAYTQQASQVAPC